MFCSPGTVKKHGQILESIKFSFYSTSTVKINIRRTGTVKVQFTYKIDSAKIYIHVHFTVPSKGDPGNKKNR